MSTENIITKVADQQTGLVLVSEQNLAIAKKIDQVVNAALSTRDMGVFERTYVQAAALAQMEELMTDEYMAPIMKLQGRSIGFRTDEDSKKGYTLEAVRKCLMEAMLQGLQPIGNQFNIIANKPYSTKEGYEALLRKIPNLWKELIQQVPKMENGGATVENIIKWKMPDGQLQTRTITVPIKVNAGMGADAILGKAERKAKRWLYEHLTGNTLPDGDIVDVDIQVMDTKPITPKPQPERQTQNQQTNAQQSVVNEKPERNAHLEDAEVVTDNSTQNDTAPKSEESQPATAAELPKSEPKVRNESDEQKRADGYLSKAKDLADLEKRLIDAQKIPNFDNTVYLELKEKLSPKQ